MASWIPAPAWRRILFVRLPRHTTAILSKRLLAAKQRNPTARGTRRRTTAPQSQPAPRRHIHTQIPPPKSAPPLSPMGSQIRAEGRRVPRHTRKTIHQSPHAEGVQRLYEPEAPARMPTLPNSQQRSSSRTRSHSAICSLPLCDLAFAPSPFTPLANCFTETTGQPPLSPQPVSNGLQRTRLHASALRSPHCSTHCLTPPRCKAAKA